MAAMAIESDLLVGLPYLQQKPLSTRGLKFLRTNPRRARSDKCGQHEELIKRNGRPKHEGSRLSKLALVFETEISDELTALSYKLHRKHCKAARREARRLREQVLAISGEGFSLVDQEAQLQQLVQEELPLLRDPVLREKLIADLETDPDIGDHTTAVMLEQIEQQLLEHVAA